MPLKPIPVLILALVAASCSKPPEPAPPTPPKLDVVLLPTEEFPRDEAIKVAATVAADTGLQIRAVLPMGTQEWKPYSDRPQFDPKTLETLALPVIERLKTNYGGKVYIILTSRDIGPPDKSLNFMFSWSDHGQKISVVSAARMVFDQHGHKASSDVIQSRLRKMVLRTVGLQYYQLQRSSDIRDVTYSPLMSVDDLDQMGLTLRTK